MGAAAAAPAGRALYALMPTREEAVAELGSVFEMIAALGPGDVFSARANCARVSRRNVFPPSF